MDGFKYASIAIIIDAAYKLSNGAIKNKFHLILWLLSAIITFLYPSANSAILLIIIGAITNYLYDR